MTLLTSCRCGSDLHVGKGEFTFCPHCDRACVTGGGCEHCSRLRRTCTDCRTTHRSEVLRAQCEEQHRP